MLAKELSDGINVSPASVAVSVKRMQKSGLITKISDENDLRCNRIALTEMASSVPNIYTVSLTSLTKDVQRLHKRGAFTSQQLLNRLIDNISEDAPSEKQFLK